MEIHRPPPSLLSLKHLVVELATITAGVLIALTLEGLTATIHHRALVRDARANLASEMRDNKRKVDELLRQSRLQRDQLTVALAFVGQLLADETPKDVNLSLDLALANLSAASKSTADLTGAPGYMDYSEVKKTTTVYELQAEFLRFQDRMLEVWIPLYNVTQGGAIEKKGADEWRRWQQQLVTALSYLQARDSLAKSLSATYAETLSTR